MNQREQINLNQNWKFHLGAVSEPRALTMKSLSLGGLTTPVGSEPGKKVILGPSGGHFLGLVGQGDQDKGLAIVAGTDIQSDLDDTWTDVTLPHDWKRQQPYQNDPQLMMNGFKPDGIAYYRKSFQVSSDLLGRRLTLHFDGIMGVSDIWYNGAYLKHNLSGYTTVDIDVTALTRYGDEGANTVLVKTDTTHGAEGWWYEGAGIYRDVWLEVTDPVHLVADDCYLSTIQLASAEAVICAHVSILNESDEDQSVAPTINLDKRTIQFEPITLEAHGQRSLSQTFTLADYKTWSPETPDFYLTKFTIQNDQVIKSFGVKTVEYKLDGFYLNHHKYEIRGVCYHQDFAGVGIAQTKDILEYKLKLLKKAGVNAIRSAHHFASPDLMDLCDRLGILLLNENRLLETTPWRINNLKHMVKLSRMHPSLAFWSLSNEELVGNTAAGGRLNNQMATIIRQLDKEHIIVQAELLNPEGIIDEDYVSHIDVLGVNYPESEVMGAGAQRIHEKHPNLPMMCTENACYFTTRGEYRDQFNQGKFNNFGSMYSMVFPGKGKPGDPGLGGTANPERVLEYVRQHPYMGGTFIWTGFDYYGEPSPLSWPSVTSSYGLADICGFAKDYYYYYQAHWSSENVLHLMPSWNPDKIEISDNGTTPVRVYTNMDEVQILVNDHDYGRQLVKDGTVNLTVTYEPGTLRAVGYKDGQQVLATEQVTAGKAVKLEVTCVKDGDNQALYAVTAKDAQNHFADGSTQRIKCHVTDGKVLALNNGNPFNHDDQSLTEIELFNGRALVIVQKQGAPKIQVTLLP